MTKASSRGTHSDVSNIKPTNDPRDPSGAQPPNPDLRSALDSVSESERNELLTTWGLIEASGARFASAEDQRDAGEAASTEKSWEAIAGKLARSQPVSPQRRSVRSDRGPRILRLVTLSRITTVAAAVAFAALAFQWFVPATVRTAPGTHQSVVLADGSTVELNSESAIQFDRRLRATFAAQRHVRLTGEAFFNVVKGEKPFVVATPNASVRVLGTQFNVRARQTAGRPQTSVAVVEGHVALTTRGTATVDLTTGQVAVAESDSAPERTTGSAERIAEWRTGALVLIDLPVGDIFAELERRFGKRIDVAEGVDLSTRKTAYYSADRSLSSILGDLCVSERLAYRPTSTGFRIELP